MTTDETPALKPFIHPMNQQVNTEQKQCEWWKWCPKRGISVRCFKPVGHNEGGYALVVRRHEWRLREVTDQGESWTDIHENAIAPGELVRATHPAEKVQQPEIEGYQSFLINTQGTQPGQAVARYAGSAEYELRWQLFRRVGAPGQQPAPSDAHRPARAFQPPWEPPTCDQWEDGDVHEPHILWPEISNVVLCSGVRRLLALKEQDELKAKYEKAKEERKSATILLGNLFDAVSRGYQGKDGKMPHYIRDAWNAARNYLEGVPIPSPEPQRCGFCEDTGWVVDANWEPDQPWDGAREPGNGLVRCSMGCKTEEELKDA